MQPQHFTQSLLVTDDALFDAHRSRGYHPERPERLEAARRAMVTLRTEGFSIESIAARDASDEEITRAHAPAYLEELARLAGHWAALDADTYVSPKSVAAARRAAGAAIRMVEALFEVGAPHRAGIVLVRPPGHHATRVGGMGFCLLNNAAIAAHAALERGARRVAIVDWDVHHGNGTQDIFYTDPRVLYVSLHQVPLYPGTGALAETGEGAGAGTTVNIPLSANATDAVYHAAFDEIVVPVVDHFEPDLVLISAGFDAHERDPLASMNLTEGGYALMASQLAAVAARHAHGRIALLLEGGYDLAAIEGALAASARSLLQGAGAAKPTGGLSAEHRRELDTARAVAARSFPRI